MATKSKSRRRPKLAGPGSFDNASDAKKALKAGQTNKHLKQIPDKGIVVRFLDEPHEMNGYLEHWMTVGGPQPCIEGGDCEGCNSDDEKERRKSMRYLANGYVVDEQRVMAIKLPKTVYELLMGYYSKKGTILDRDYELTKTGSGMENTKYLVNPDSPSKINLSRFKKLDLEEILYSLLGLGSDEDDEDDDDDEDDTRRRPKSTKKKRRPVYDDEDDEDDEDDDDDEDEPLRRRKKKSSTVVKNKKSGSVVKSKKNSGKSTRVIKRNR